MMGKFNLYDSMCTNLEHTLVIIIRYQYTSKMPFSFDLIIFWTILPLSSFVQKYIIEIMFIQNNHFLEIWPGGTGQNEAPAAPGAAPVRMHFVLSLTWAINYISNIFCYYYFIPHNYVHIAIFDLCSVLSHLEILYFSTNLFDWENSQSVNNHKKCLTNTSHLIRNPGKHLL